MVLTAHSTTGDDMLIKFADITAHIVFHYTKYHESMSTLGEVGAEKLKGKGRFIFKSDGQGNGEMQGLFISPEDIKEILSQMNFDYNCDNKFEIDLETQLSETQDITTDDSNFSEIRIEKIKEGKFAKVLIEALSSGYLSINTILNECSLNHTTAKKIMDDLERLKFVSEADSTNPKNPKGRTVIPNSIDEIPQAIMDILKRNGYSEDAIKEAINRQQTQ